MAGGAAQAASHRAPVRRPARSPDFGKRFRFTPGTRRARAEQPSGPRERERPPAGRGERRAHRLLLAQPRPTPARVRPAPPPSSRPRPLPGARPRPLCSGSRLSSQEGCVQLRAPGGKVVAECGSPLFRFQVAGAGSRSWPPSREGARAGGSLSAAS